LVEASLPEARRRRLFVASCMALTATAVTFAIRGDILGDLRTTFSLSNEDLGKAAGAWAYGFTLSIFVGGQLVDILGMKRIVAVAFLMHVLGVVLTIFATGFWTLFTGTLCIGLGNGLVEAFVNPLTATIYPDRKTEKLNLLHVWFPGGIVIGGLVAFALALMGLGWKVRMAFILLPTLLYGALFLGQEFPPTERVQQGVSTGGMYRAVLRPLFVVIVFCMILTASTELATNQWIAYILSNTAGMAAGGILVLVWINGLMAVGRWFAGPMVHRLSAIGLLIASAALSAVGLVGLSLADSPWTAIAAATVFAIGICYFWPTMLGVTSERFPDGGALALAIVGGTGTLAAAIFTWILGGMYDRMGPRMALRYMAVLPVVLIVVFSAIWLHDRRSRGERA
jgi:predicted MFS family arabinose efflux permease